MNLLRGRKFLFVLLVQFVIPLSAEIYKEKAVVSYYAGDFNGKKTSNGEFFNMNDYTCASKTLPFDSILKVTNLANGLSVQVRVNDRGPFVADRELDLSKAAAQKIGMIKSGTATVKIEILKKGSDTALSQQTALKAAQIKTGKTESKPVVSKKSVNTDYPKGTFWDIQLGSFSTRENASKLAQQLLRDGFEDVIFQKGKEIIRVVIRGVPAEKMKKTKEELNRLGYENYVVRQRKE